MPHTASSYFLSYFTVVFVQPLWGCTGATDECLGEAVHDGNVATNEGSMIACLTEPVRLT